MGSYSGCEMAGERYVMVGEGAVVVDGSL